MINPHDIQTEVRAREVIARQYAYDQSVVEAAHRVVQRNTEARESRLAAASDAMDGIINLIEQGKVIKLDAWQTYLLEDR